ncbi:MAG: fold metallo-hydrolase [Rhodospirillales bacterium]|jgi:glyoxylase-like metal-dependent hydrolase (beta-lactamase superfamily II)|nr:fold metallo-hydrolase [Rhodospirillales bacterium]MDB5380529.1 fold metallo-hydrolase [Rhodospirillales bacterium]
MVTATRRALLAMGATALAVPHITAEAFAAAPMRAEAAPAWYRFRQGGFEMTVVSDGPLPIRPASSGFIGVNQSEMEGLLRSNFLATDHLPLEQNVLIVNTGRQLILFDAGMGNSMGALSQMFGPTSGRLLANMRAAGIEPAQIDLIALTHAHCDHCWGLVDANGAKVFPNAQVAISEADLNFWTNDANKRGPEFMTAFVDGAKKNLNAYRDRMVMARDGADVAPGIRAMALPGHSIGHTAYVISDGGQTIINSGDLSHHHVLLLQRPNWKFAFDSDPDQAARTRVRFLDMVSTDRTEMLSYHFPWPGNGHVLKVGEGYAWVPAPVRTML